MVGCSPLMYDIDSDGVMEVIIVTYDGEVLAYKESGVEHVTGVEIPRLKVRTSPGVSMCSSGTLVQQLDVNVLVWRCLAREWPTAVICLLEWLARFHGLLDRRRRKETL